MQNRPCWRTGTPHPPALHSTHTGYSIFLHHIDDTFPGSHALSSCCSAAVVIISFVTRRHSAARIKRGGAGRSPLGLNTRMNAIFMEQSSIRVFGTFNPSLSHAMWPIWTGKRGTGGGSWRRWTLCTKAVAVDAAQLGSIYWHWHSERRWWWWFAFYVAKIGSGRRRGSRKAPYGSVKCLAFRKQREKERAPTRMGRLSLTWNYGKFIKL